MNKPTEKETANTAENENSPPQGNPDQHDHYHDDDDDSCTSPRPCCG